MVKFVYIDETGSVSAKVENQPVLQIVAAIVDEGHVQPLANSMRELAHKHLGWSPNGFEFHGNEIWNGSGYWASKSPPELLAAYEDLIGLIPTHEIAIAHASIDRPKLHRRHGGAADGNAYLLALQFLLEKVHNNVSGLKIVVADESKEHQLKAMRMVADMQEWGGGEVLGAPVPSIIDSLHFVQSHASYGVQMADLIAYLMHRQRLRAVESHPGVQEARERMAQVYRDAIVTWRARWPA